METTHLLKAHFGLGVAHYDQPPPDSAPDVEALLAADAIRFANPLHAWIEVTGRQITAHGMSGGGRLGSTTVRLRSHGVTFAGVALPDISPPPEAGPDRVRFSQTAGGHTGAPVPRAVPHPPYWRLTAPVAWSTVTVILSADGSSQAELAAASVFPRHYLYDSAGQLIRKSALIRYKDWIRQSEPRDSPWGGGGEKVPVAGIRGPAERSLADAILVSGQYRRHCLPEGALLREVAIADGEVYLLLDGLVRFEIDQQPVAEAGPGAIFDPALRAPYSRQHAVIRATTSCRLAILPRSQLDSQSLIGASAEAASRLDAWRAGHDQPE